MAGLVPSMLFHVVVSTVLLVQVGMCMRMTVRGEYTSITVIIQEHGANIDCNLLNNLQNLLVDTTSTVGSALSWVAWPSSYTVVLPTHWKEESCNCNITIKQAKGDTRYTQPDMVIQSLSPVSLSSPYTLQSKGCGSPGDYISIPTSFLSKTNITTMEASARAKILAHQFVKLRFGVFDERGFPGDKLYPGHYKAGGTIHPTGSSNTMVNGIWKRLHQREDIEDECRPDTDTCVFHPIGDNSEVTCSLGYLPYLPNIQGYCPRDQEHLPLSPTKQTILCSGRSVLQTIETSHDWIQLSSSTSKTPPSSQDTKPRIHFVRARSPRYVLVLETSAVMAENGDWKFISKALQKLIQHDLPDTAQVAVVTFSNVSRVEAMMTIVGGNRLRISDSVPDKYRLATDSGSCVLCGVTVALSDILGDDSEGAHIVLVTRGSEDTLSDLDKEELREKVEYLQVTVSSVLVPTLSQPIIPFYDELSRLSGGRTSLVTAMGPIERYRQVSRALTGVLEVMERIVVEEQLVKVEGEETVTEGSFLVDSVLGKNTQLGIYVEDEEEHLIKSIMLQDNSGKEYGPYTRLSTQYDTTNMKTISFGLGSPSPLSLPSHVGTTWSYVVKWHKPRRERVRQAAVVVTSATSGDTEDYRVDVWSNSEQSLDIVTSQHPLGLYVRVGRGDTPVLGAHVTLLGKVATDNGSLVMLSPIVLGDGGEGDPDIMAEDGVYSGYLVEYPSTGRYSFSVVVQGKMAEIPLTEEERDSSVCCGRTTGLSQGKVETLNQWRRELRDIVSIRLDQVPDMGGEDRSPPSRIVDLEARVASGSRKVVLTWTSPGGDWMEGKVVGYTLVQGEEVSVLLKGEGQILTQWEREEMGGLRTSYELRFPIEDKEVWLGLQGRDSGGNLGSVSNIVSVVVPSQEVEQSARTVQDVEVIVPPNEEVEEWMMILALCGSFLLLAVCLMAGVLYFLRCSKPRKTMGSVVTTEEATDSSSTSSCTDPKNCSSHRLVPDLFSQLSPRALEPRPFTAPPSSLPDATPTYWSASQLLTEHEQRALTSSYAPLSPIREEYIGYPEERWESGQCGLYRLDTGHTNPGFRTVIAETGKEQQWGRQEESSQCVMSEAEREGHCSLSETARGEQWGASVSPRGEQWVATESGRGEQWVVSQTSRAEQWEASQSGRKEQWGSPESGVFGVIESCSKEIDKMEDTVETERTIQTEEIGNSEGRIETPVKFSTAVQTVAPSTIATLRQNTSYMASIKSRSVSLV